MNSRKKIRVLQAPGALNIGGAETMIVNIYRHIDRSKIDFEFLVNGPETGYYEKEITALGGRIHHLPQRSKNIIWYHICLLRLLRQRQYDIIHIHTQNAFLTSLQIITARLAGTAKIVVHSHNTMDWRGRRLLFLHQWFRGYLNKHSDIRLACGTDAAKWLYGTDYGVKLIPLPVKCADFLFSRERYNRLRTELGVNDEIVYTHIGRFSDAKNHCFLIEIFRELLVRDSRSVLFLIGVGELKEEIENMVRQIGIEQSVVFWGSRSDVGDKLIMTDVFLLPSKYEGFPTVLLEAQAAGLPCFIADTITPGIMITDLVRRIPLSDRAAQWADTITADMQSRQGVNDARAGYNNRVAAMYDVTVTVERITEIYKALVTKEKE